MRSVRPCSWDLTSPRAEAVRADRLCQQQVAIRAGLHGGAAVVPHALGWMLGDGRKDLLHLNNGRCRHARQVLFRLAGSQCW